jgi:hypothetical protein
MTRWTERREVAAGATDPTKYNNNKSSLRRATVEEEEEELLVFSLLDGT